MTRRFTAIAARGTEGALAAEIAELLEIDVESLTIDAGAVHFESELDAAYRVALASRISSRVLLPLFEREVYDADELYEEVRRYLWERELDPETTFAIEAAIGARRRDLHARYVVQRVKDGVVDRLREVYGERPDVDREDPDVRIHVYFGETATLSIDLFGPLHRRGVRQPGAAAPLRENLAAAILRLSGWWTSEGPAGPLFDPMCGSGTLLVEAGWIARRRAPGLSPPGSPRPRLGGWKRHEPAAFGAELTRLESLELEQSPVLIAGSDEDEATVALARQTLRAAGLSQVRVRVAELADAEPPAVPEGQVGHLVTNPPYGERLGEVAELRYLYERIGDTLKARWGGWQAHLFCGRPELLKRVGLKTSARHPLFNGPLEARLASYAIRAAKGGGGAIGEGRPVGWRKLSPEAEGFANRVRKNQKALNKWVAREGIEAYRLYDADMPEYKVAVDVYGDQVLVQEYSRPRRVDPRDAERRLDDVVRALPELLDVPREQVHLRVRERQRDGGQYERRGRSGAQRGGSARHEPASSADTRFPVREGELRFLVDLGSYLDTGLFLDHRDVRGWVRDHVAERAEREGRQLRVLNLFAYTASVSVYAAAAGARTTSVDLSGTYLDWAKDNFRLDDIDPRAHFFIRADVLRWLEDERHGPRFDLVFVNPPSFSRSKSMRGDFDLTRDQGHLLGLARMRVAPGGTLLFTTHRRDFELDAGLARNATELTDLVPRDFRGNPFRAWRFGG